MEKVRPLWERLYFDEVYVEIARRIGYQGTTYRDLAKLLEPLEQRFGKQRVQSAAYHVVTYEGEMTCNPKPLAEVKLRPEVRKLCWQLLGPPPESKQAFETKPELPPNEETQHTPKQLSSKQARKKKPTPAKPVEQPATDNRPAANSSAIMDHFQAAKEKFPDMMLLFRNVAK